MDIHNYIMDIQPIIQLWVNVAKDVMISICN